MVRTLCRPAYILFVILALAALNASASDAKPLKVFILAGQSNMQGMAHEHRLRTLAEDPATKVLHAKLVDDSGKPRVFEKVDIVYFSTWAFKKPATPLKKQGKLTSRFGGNGYGEPKFVRWGPELAFGAVMDEALDEPFLIIKTAWGGTNLHTDWRPPSAPAVENEKAGKIYRMFLEKVHEVLADLGKYAPAYDPKQGYEIAGFVWFQAWNDMIDGGTYPEGTQGKPGGYDLYAELLTHFIKDVRKEFKTPKMPFVIGVTGHFGMNPEGPNVLEFRKAQAAPANLPEFKGTVVAVSTAEFWDDKLHDIEGRLRRFRQYKAPTPPKGFEDIWGKFKELDKEFWELRKGTPETKNQRQARQRKIMDEITKLIFTPEELEYKAEHQTNAGYHYHGSARTFAQIGEAFAKGMLAVMKK